MSDSNDRRPLSGSIFRAAAAAASAILAAPAATQTLAQEAFTLDIPHTTGSSAPSTHLWDDPNAWTSTAPAPETEYPGFDDTDDVANVVFRESPDAAGDATINIDLNGGSYSIGTLNLSEGGGNGDGNFLNGTLTVANINYTGGSRELDFLDTATVNGAGGSLAINLTGNNIEFIGPVNAPTSFTLTTSGTQLVKINRSAAGVSMTASLGAVTHDGGAALLFQSFDSTTSGAAAGLDRFTVASLAITNLGKIELDRTTGSVAYHLDVTGLTTVGPVAGARLQVEANDDDGTLNMNGGLLLNNGGNGVQIDTIADQRAVISVASSLNESVATPDPLTINLHGSTSGLGDFGTLNVAAGTTSNRTAPTTIVRGRVNLDADGGFGSGQINVQRDGILNLGIAQTALDVDVQEFGAIGGNLSGATYGTNVMLAPQNVIFLQGTTNLPTTAQTGGAIHLLGLTANTGTFTVGDDGNAGTTDDIYRGIALGAGINPSGDFAGAVAEALSGQGIHVHMVGPKRFGGGGGGPATFTTTNAATGVTFSGTGLVDINDPGIIAPLITRVGDSAVQNATILRFSDANAFDAGQTINVTDGRIDLDSATAVQNGATVNVNDGATLSLDQTPSTGTFNINAGGAIALDSATAASGAATFNYADGALYVINFDGTTAIPTNVDVVIHDGDGDSFPDGIAIGNGRRLTTSSTNSIDVNGGPVTAAPGAAGVTFSAGAGRTLDINSAVELSGVALQFGDTDPFTTIVSGGTGGTNYGRATVAQSGTVNIDGTVTVGPITVVAGTATMTSAVNAASITVEGGAANFSGAVTTPADVAVTGGVALVSGDLSAPGVTASGTGTFRRGGGTATTAVAGGFVATAGGTVESFAVDAFSGQTLRADAGGTVFGNGDTAGGTNLFRNAIIQLNGGTLQWDNGSEDDNPGGAITLLADSTLDHYNADDTGAQSVTFASLLVPAGRTLTVTKSDASDGTHTTNFERLAGSGTITGQRVRVPALGVLAPGDGPGQAGTLSVDLMNYASTADYEFDVDASGAGDRVDIVGPGAAFVIAGSGDYEVLVGGAGLDVTGASPLQDFVILTWAATDPTSANWFLTGANPEATIVVDNANNQIRIENLSVVPEPASAGLLAMIGSAALLPRRRRKSNG